MSDGLSKLVISFVITFAFCGVVFFYLHRNTKEKQLNAQSTKETEIISDFFKENCSVKDRCNWVCFKRIDQDIFLRIESKNCQESAENILSPKK